MKTRNALLLALASILATSAQAYECGLEAIRLTDLSQTTEETRTTSVLSFVAMSNGCTTEKDFKVSIAKTGKAQSIRIVRIKRDPCKAMPRETNVQIELKNLKIGTRFPIVIANPILPTGSFYETGTLLPLE